ncbi:MAG: hypothetical protein NZV14_03495 [Bryobacteraceae bacterium]|nr:hypothetical protein [Bryobacteraceae bacterium]MDW8377201.1 hypothetical protein [Bryobacterales bacterium]
MNPRRNLLPRLLAGLEAGILGGLLILLWFLLLSYLGFRSPWGLFNLIASSLQQRATWGLALSSSTWTGLAAHTFACGCLGMFLGWVIPKPSTGRRLSLTAFVFGVIVSLMVYEFFWMRYVPLLGDYVRPLAAAISHLLFGLALAQFPKFYHALEESPVGAQLSTPAGEQRQALAQAPAPAPVQASSDPLQANTSGGGQPQPLEPEPGSGSSSQTGRDQEAAIS